jgi:O-methyltransferase
MSQKNARHMLGVFFRGGIMGSSAPFIAPAVVEYTDRINAARATPAEIVLQTSIEALPDTMSSVAGVTQKIWHMDSGVGQCRLLTMLTRDLSRQHNRPMKALDIGTFAGHSAGALAKGMEENGGTVITCDLDDRFLSIAKTYWQSEGVIDRIDFRIGPADNTLKTLLADPSLAGSFDIVYIDADKRGYDDYYEQALKLARVGGKIILDNMLWSGRVADLKVCDANTDALRALGEKISRDLRVDAILLNSDDGLMIAEKR